MQVAVLDIGTNAVRYLLAEKNAAAGGAITGLGRGLQERGELAPIAMEATLSAVAGFLRALKALRPTIPHRGDGSRSGGSQRRGIFAAVGASGG